MSRIKDYFKKKYTLTALSFILIGAFILLVLPLFPHGAIYRSDPKLEYSINEREYVDYIEFIGKGKVKRYIKFKDNGEIDDLEILPYTIEDSVLYIDGIDYGTIDVYKVNITYDSIVINDKKAETNYIYTTALIAKYISYGLVVLGVFMIIQPIFIKKKH
jgi:hypothetical protein